VSGGGGGGDDFALISDAAGKAAVGAERKNGGYHAGTHGENGARQMQMLLEGRRLQRLCEVE